MADNNQSSPEMNSQPTGSFWSRHSRLFIRLIIIAVIIVGAVIYSNQQNPDESDDQNQETASDNEADNQDDVSMSDGGDVAGINVTDHQDDSQQVQVIKDESQTEPVMVSGGQVTVTVQRGNGYTHLARRAITEYLSTHEVSGLQAEHQIFAEDYLQKSITDRHRLFAGDEVSFSEDKIKESLDAALSLSSSQVQNLSQYVF